MITNKKGEILGTGTIKSPLKFKEDGKAVGTWTFAAAWLGPKEKDPAWVMAKNQLSAGRGKVEIECEKGWFTLDFNPGWADNNVTMSWATDKDKEGTLYYCDIAGGHPCAKFRFKDK